MTTVLNIQSDDQLDLLMDWILTEDGYEVINVDGPGGVAAQPHPDVIIVNTNMAESEKRACIEVLRALVPGVGILDLSVGAEDGAYDTGANAYLNKPFDAVDLLDRVHSIHPAGGGRAISA